MNELGLGPTLVEAGVPGALFSVIVYAAYRIITALWLALQQREGELRDHLREMMVRHLQSIDQHSAMLHRHGTQLFALRQEIQALVRMQGCPAVAPCLDAQVAEAASSPEESADHTGAASSPVD